MSQGHGIWKSYCTVLYVPVHIFGSGRRQEHVKDVLI